MCDNIEINIKEIKDINDEKGPDFWEFHNIRFNKEYVDNFIM